MGWASGSELMSDVITAVQECVPEGSRKNLYRKLIAAFETADWDTQDECAGLDPEFDEALEEGHPGIDPDEE
jgi:hypothetical protein